jgi:hypothetical protein
MFVRLFNVPGATPLLIAAALSPACSATSPAQRLRYADAIETAPRLDWSRPVELEFEPGDRLPISVAFSDQAFELRPAAPALELVATRHCVVRIEDGHITESLNGDFAARPLAPGSFRFGLAITRQGKRLELAVTTPRHAEPAPAAP